MRACGGWLVAVGMLSGCAVGRGQTVPLDVSVLRLPGGVAYDAAGDMFVADTLGHRVLELSLAGVTTVVAGTGEQGFGGDGGVATAAMLNAPAAVAVGADGTLYVADAGNQRVRAVVGGKIRTVAGTGVAGFEGEGSDALLAKLRGPAGLTVEGSGALLIADSGNHRVRRLADGKLTTIAGSGLQGFGGDGGAAVAALLDTPMGVAVASDGRVFVADSHNHRVRMITVEGTITTFAGSAAKGFGGDGAAATGAALFVPRGVAVTSAGDVLIADADNHRVRSVNARGIITTLAGDGVQGRAVEGTVAVAAALDTPRGVTVSGFGAPVFSDSRNRDVRTIAADAAAYVVAPGAVRTAAVTVVDPGALTYGAGSVSVKVTGAAPAVLGSVSVREGVADVGGAALSGSAAVVPVDGLGAGSHAVTAVFSGDGLHGAAMSAPVTVMVNPRSVVATAATATMVYGGTAPVLTGSLTGVLARDAGNVAATFVSSAPDLAPVGTYPILASLTGSASANYALAAGGSLGGLQVVQAAANVSVATPAVAYGGLPVTLSATVVSTTRGMPTGVVSFFDNGTLVGTANAVGGVASTVYLSPATGAHSLTATYAGDRNFLASVSPAASLTVGAMPDFTLAVNGPASQTVPGGGIASYVLQVAPQAAPFSGVVSFSASGGQSGAAVSFSPVNVVPGSGSVAVTMTVQTKALAAVKPMRSAWSDHVLAALMVMPFGFALRRRKRIAALAAWFVCIFASGCGARTVATARAVQSFPVTVTATSTNLAGAVVTHSVAVNLTVD